MTIPHHDGSALYLSTCRIPSALLAFDGAGAAYSTAVVLSRRWSAFLVLVGVWSWLIWPRFAAAIWADPRSWHGSTPTGFLWIHAVLIVVSLTVGTAVGVLGLRGWRAARSRKPS